MGAGVAVGRFGDAALRAALPGPLDARALLDALRRLPGAIDAVVTEGHALVTFDPAAPPGDLEDALARAIAEAPLRPAAPGRAHRVRVRYDGEDLDEVARRAGVSPRELVAIHAAGTYAVATVGFMPGFAYLRGVDPRIAVPRRPSPRARVPPLAVALAGPYTGVYPFASPGGWN